MFRIIRNLRNLWNLWNFRNIRPPKKQTLINNNKQ